MPLALHKLIIYRTCGCPENGYNSIRRLMFSECVNYQRLFKHFRSFKVCDTHVEIR